MLTPRGIYDMIYGFINNTESLTSAVHANLQTGRT